MTTSMIQGDRVILRENALIDGKYFSDVVMSLLDREWASNS